jgi:hypothetical protein
MLTTTVRIGNGQKAQLTLDEEYLEEEDFLQGSSFRNTLDHMVIIPYTTKCYPKFWTLSMPAPLV